jgi:hypothetical protein
MAGKRGPKSDLAHLDEPILHQCRELKVQDSRMETVLKIYKKINAGRRRKGLGPQPTSYQCTSDRIYVRIKNVINK